MKQKVGLCSALVVTREGRLGLNGPAVIEQLDATTLLYPGDSLIVDAAGSLLVEVQP